MADQLLASETPQANPAHSMRHLLAALYQRPGSTVCAALSNQLYDYTFALVNWNNDLLQFAEVAQHLDRCVACSEAFSRLYELQLNLKLESLPTPGTIPTPDLSFLQPTQELSLANRLRAAVTRVGKQVSLQLSGELIPLFRPALAVSTLRSAQSAQYSETLLRLEATPLEAIRVGTPTWVGEPWPATLTVYRNQRRPDQCLLEVRIALPDRFWPDLAGATVSVTVDEETRTHSTDAWGIASFEDVAIADLARVKVSLELE